MAPGTRRGRLTFTEVVFEVADERYPLCRLTASPSTANAILRVLDPGRATGRFRTLITFYGTHQEATEFPRELRAYRSGGDVEVLSQTEGSVTVRTDAPTTDAGAASVRLFAVLKLLDGFGPDTIVEPFLFRRGRVRARLLVPRRIDTQRVLQALQDVQRSSGFHEFRIVRVTPLAAERYLDLLRRILTPEQEELLRLAASMGYYDTPKGATLEEIASRVGLSVSPVHKRLKTIEETLVGAHVEGTSSLANVKRRRRRAVVELPRSSPAEIAVRVRWPESAISRFIASSPGARGLLQAIGADPASGFATFLVVFLAPETDYERFLVEFAKRPDVLGIDIVDKDKAHCSARVRLRMATGSGATSPWWTEIWGADAISRPFIFEGEDVTVRILLMKTLPEPEIQQRIERMAKLAGWTEHEIVSARSADDLRIPQNPPEPPTARQEEVLKIAHALGYYRTPRACTLEHVAATLGVSANAIHKNLSSAESRVITSYLSAGL